MRNLTLRSFTLIEVLVSVSIFSLIMVILAGVFVSAFKVQKRSLAKGEMLNQVSYALEYIGRALRMAKKDLEGSCISAKSNYEITHGGQGIKFQNYKGECQEFYLEDTILRENKNGVIANLTSPDLEISSFRINPHGWDQDDNFQPRITLFLEIKTKNQAGGASQLKIQTTLSQRNLDVPR